MDEIADLIRLLAEAPAEEAPMARPKEFLDRLAIERVARGGIQPEGPAVPAAEVSLQGPMAGTPAQFNLSQPEADSPANPAPPPVQFGAVADPRTGVPDIGMPVRVYSTEAFWGMAASPEPPVTSTGTVAAPEFLDTITGTAATPESLETIAGMPASPQAAKDSSQTEGYSPAEPNPPSPQTGAVATPRADEITTGASGRVYATETFLGKVATPKILDTMAGMPASPQAAGDRVGIANPTPRSEVTITIPPAFPMDPKEAFSMVDEQLSLPPQQEPRVDRVIGVDTSELVLESTEEFVAKSYQAREGSRSDLDRWSI